MINSGLMTSKSQEWCTPLKLFRRLHKEFKFTLDPASTHENALCKKHYTKEENGLDQTWEGETVFCNPPYGREIAQWVQKAYEETRKGKAVVVMLIPARTDTSYWHDYILNGKASEIRFIRGRIKFSEAKNGAPFPSAIVVFES